MVHKVHSRGDNMVDYAHINARIQAHMPRVHPIHNLNEQNIQKKKGTLFLIEAMAQNSIDLIGWGWGGV